VGIKKRLVRLAKKVSVCPEKANQAKGEKDSRERPKGSAQTPDFAVGEKARKREGAGTKR